MLSDKAIRIIKEYGPPEWEGSFELLQLKQWGCWSLCIKGILKNLIPCLEHNLNLTEFLISQDLSSPLVNNLILLRGDLIEVIQELEEDL
jgi:hypothetical protein